MTPTTVPACPALDPAEPFDEGLLSLSVGNRAFIWPWQHTVTVAVGAPRPWAAIAIALGLLATSFPALADQMTVHMHDEDAVLVGEPSDEVHARAQQDLPATSVGAGTFKEYRFTVDAADNRLDVDLSYDPGRFLAVGPCLKANDLDLFVEGPGWKRSYPGCDGGELIVLAEHVPPGDYTVRIEADRGSTLCLDPGASGCAPGELHYELEIRVWDRG